MVPDASEAVDAVYRSDWGRIVAALIGLVGDFDLAEECAQEAFTIAVDQWRVSGVPEFPRSWLIQTVHMPCKRRSQPSIAGRRAPKIRTAGHR